MITVTTAAAMETLGAELALRSQPGMVLYLVGELGAGKTTLVRGFLRQLGARQAIKSPTFTLIEPYDIGGRRIYHLDLYRLSTAEELEYLGIRDCAEASTICLIEWPERGAGWLPAADAEIHIRYTQSTRQVDLVGHTDILFIFLNRLQKLIKICFNITQ